MRRAENTSTWSAIELDRGTDWTDVVAVDCGADEIRLSVAPRSPEIPEALWERAKQGDAQALRNIGTMYDFGQQGAAQSYSDALRWYRVAANRGDDWSMARIGIMYAVGKGASENDDESIRWLRLAADKGNAVAMESIGQMYYDGTEVPQSYEEAYFWLSLAASVSPSDIVSTNNPVKILEMCRVVRDAAAERLSATKLTEIKERARLWTGTHPRIH